MNVNARLFAGALFIALMAMASVACSHLLGNKQEGASLRKKPGRSLGNPTAKASAADNSRCYVCHANYEAEQLVAIHVTEGVGCEKCHGASDTHCGDEGHLTPPDKMYAKEDINALCLTCHTSSNKQYCTDCHGNHSLPRRTRLWDKKTRTLTYAE